MGNGSNNHHHRHHRSSSRHSHHHSHHHHHRDSRSKDRGSRGSSSENESRRHHSPSDSKSKPSQLPSESLKRPPEETTEQTQNITKKPKTVEVPPPINANTLHHLKQQIASSSITNSAPLPQTLSSNSASNAPPPVLGFMTREQREKHEKEAEEAAKKEAEAAAATQKEYAAALIAEQRRLESEEHAWKSYTRRQRERDSNREADLEARLRKCRDIVDRRERGTKEMRMEAQETLGMGKLLEVSRDELMRETVRERYLGKKKEHKFVSNSEKIRAARSAEWDLSDDTTIQSSILDGSDVLLRPQFGRGHFAGYDIGSQTKMFSSSQSSLKKNSNASKDASNSVDAEQLKKQEELQRKLDERAAALEDRGRSKPWQKKTLEEMTPRDWRIFKEDHRITTRGANIPNPMRAWEEEDALPGFVRSTIAECGYARPTPIQMASIPIGLQFRDILGVAETGSGKTAAFVIPMLVYISRLPPLTAANRADGPYALIMAPSRELVEQIERETARLATRSNIRVVSLVGGTSIETQGSMLQAGCEVVVATPGRILDCLKSHYVVLNQCNYLVLDEADRMITMGFERDLNEIFDFMPTTNLKSLDEAEAVAQAKAQAEDSGKGPIYRTTIMFSATMPPPVERLARKYLRHPVQVTIGDPGKVVDTIDQDVRWTTNDNTKRQLLRDALAQTSPPIIVFANTRKTVDSIAMLLRSEGFNTVTLHSGRTQGQRTQALEGFKFGQYDILVATDVASRGIDVQGIALVVNYDMPKSIEDYIHRVGRTGRAGKEGRALSFVTPEDTDIMYDLRIMLIQKKCSMPPELANHPAALYRDKEKIIN